jgi:rod shape-determining protein MreC
MRWLLELIILYRVYVSLCLTFCASIWMISSSPEMQAKTARFLTLSVFYPLQISVDQILLAKNIYEENRRLKSEVVTLSAGLAQLREQTAENDRLRSMIGFEKVNPYELIPVRILARDPSADCKSLVITAGRTKGIVPFMPVVAEGGVVGKVVMVMPHLSLVQLITDPLNRVGIMTRRSRVVSILETDNSREFFVHFRTYEDVSPGDTIITSGLGGIYPKGFIVGSIDRVVDERDPLFKKAIVKLAINIARQEELFVINQSPRWAALHSELDSLMDSP